MAASRLTLCETGQLGHQQSREPTAALGPTTAGGPGGRARGPPLRASCAWAHHEQLCLGAARGSPRALSSRYAEPSAWRPPAWALGTRCPAVCPWPCLPGAPLSGPIAGPRWPGGEALRGGVRQGEGRWDVGASSCPAPQRPGPLPSSPRSPQLGRTGGSRSPERSPALEGPSAQAFREGPVPVLAPRPDQGSV